MNKLQQHIATSPLVKAAVIEAVHRFYHDRILSNKIIDQRDLTECNVANILDTVWNLLPDWRHVLLTSPQRYDDSGEITSVPTYCKPKEITPIEVTITLK